MSHATMHPTPDRSSEFDRLPGQGGAARAVGVEIELGGLAPETVATLAARVVGGTPERKGAGRWRVSQSCLGELEIFLDTALKPDRDTALARVGVELGRRVIPVELVTPPVQQSDLASVSRIIDALEGAGAKGSRSSVFYGFGLHLNVELADTDAGSDLCAITQTFAALEPWLRERDPLDISRRVLPFTQPFPAAFVAPLCAERECTTDVLFDLIDRHIDTRNHGLDLLPAYKAIAPERFGARTVLDEAVSPRPAYHYRMPEARLGDPNWSLAYEWRRWCLVERVARDPDRLQALCGLWTRADDGKRGSAYHQAVADVLGPLAELAPEMVSRGDVVERADA